ncbi:hypothetical protein CBER1_11765 [Cercospora berteroae]|uniref:Ubiquitin-like protease family profile domain-containing protein n=1 Tax=Cercospora berteroae TaxID=357750 RepID=A0A2S6CIK5_9PEZI|nr:hypothetical protein CBER1_11765 [Cercospora berteroae]
MLSYELRNQVQLIKQTCDPTRLVDLFLETCARYQSQQQRQLGENDDESATTSWRDIDAELNEELLATIDQAIHLVIKRRHCDNNGHEAKEAEEIIRKLRGLGTTHWRLRPHQYLRDLHWDALSRRTILLFRELATSLVDFEGHPVTWSRAAACVRAIAKQRQQQPGHGQSGTKRFEGADVTNALNELTGAEGGYRRIDKASITKATNKVKRGQSGTEELEGADVTAAQKHLMHSDRGHDPIEHVGTAGTVTANSKVKRSSCPLSSPNGDSSVDMEGVEHEEERERDVEIGRRMRPEDALADHSSPAGAPLGDDYFSDTSCQIGDDRMSNSPLVLAEGRRKLETPVARKPQKRRRLVFNSGGSSPTSFPDTNVVESHVEDDPFRSRLDNSNVKGSETRLQRDGGEAEFREKEEEEMSVLVEKDDEKSVDYNEALTLSSRVDHNELSDEEGTSLVSKTEEGIPRRDDEEAPEKRGGARNHEDVSAHQDCGTSTVAAAVSEGEVTPGTEHSGLRTETANGHVNSNNITRLPSSAPPVTSHAQKGDTGGSGNLFSDAWLNDTSIFTALLVLNPDPSRFCVMDPLLFSSSRQPSRDLHHYGELLFVPLHVRGNHWNGVTVDLAQKNIDVYTPYAREGAEAAVVVQATLQNEVPDISEFHITRATTSVHQPPSDTSNCGLYCLLYFLCRMHRRDMPEVSIEQWRCFIASLFATPQHVAKEARELTPPEPRSYEDFSATSVTPAQLSESIGNARGIIASAERIQDTARMLRCITAAASRGHAQLEQDHDRQNEHLVDTQAALQLKLRPSLVQAIKEEIRHLKQVVRHLQAQLSPPGLRGDRPTALANASYYAVLLEATTTKALQVAQSNKRHAIEATRTKKKAHIEEQSKRGDQLRVLHQQQLAAEEQLHGLNTILDAA